MTRTRRNVEIGLVVVVLVLFLIQGAIYAGGHAAEAVTATLVTIAVALVVENIIEKKARARP